MAKNYLDTKFTKLGNLFERERQGILITDITGVERKNISIETDKSIDEYVSPQTNYFYLDKNFVQIYSGDSNLTVLDFSSIINYDSLFIKNTQQIFLSLNNDSKIYDKVYIIQRNVYNPKNTLEYFCTFDDFDSSESGIRLLLGTKKEINLTGEDLQNRVLSAYSFASKLLAERKNICFFESLESKESDLSEGRKMLRNAKQSLRIGLERLSDANIFWGYESLSWKHNIEKKSMELSKLHGNFYSIDLPKYVKKMSFEKNQRYNQMEKFEYEREKIKRNLFE